MVAGFVRKPMQKPRRIQPACPVRLYSYLCSVEKRSGVRCVQLRFVNCSDRQVESLFLRICGLGKKGEICYTLESVPMANCAAEPRSVFGEERLIFLPSAEIAELEITVEWVLFSDGMLWKRLPEHPFDSPEALGMVQCACGMWNGEERCDFCARPVHLPAVQAPVPKKQPEPLQHTPPDEEKEAEDFSIPDLSVEEFESMMQETAFVLRSMQGETESYEEDEEFFDEEEESLPNTSNRSMWVMLAMIAVLALLTVAILYEKGYFG